MKKAIRDAIKKYNAEVAKFADTIAAQINARLREERPELQFTSDYGFRCGFRDPGDPGWGSVNMVISNLNNIEVGAGISVSASAGVTPTAEHPSGPSPKDSPVATVKGWPRIQTNISMEVEGGVGLKLSGALSTTLSSDLTDKALSAKIEAGKHTSETYEP